MARQSYTLLKTTPTIEKISGAAVALSPTASAVADCGKADEQYFLRLTDYQSGREIARQPIPHGAHTLEFSPDGKHLLVMPGGRGHWSQLLVFAAPWNSPPIVNSNKELDSAYHGAWIDDCTILIAGTVVHGDPCVALLNIGDGQINIVHEETIPAGADFGSNNLDTGACSRTGRVAFGIGYGRGFKLLQLADDRRSMIDQGRFAGRYTGNTYNMAIDDKTGSIACGYEKGLTLFDAQGRELSSLSAGITTPPMVVCRSGVLAYRLYTGRGVAEVRVQTIGIDGLTPWSTYPAEGHARGCDVKVEDDRTLLAVEEEDHTRVLVLTDVDVLLLDAEESAQRRAAVNSVRSRRYRPARDTLIRRVEDEAEEQATREAALRALAEMQDPQAIPALLRTLGGRPPPALAAGLLSALLDFDPDEMIRVARECASRPWVKLRRGALLALADLPKRFDVVDALAQALSDSDREARLIAARALGQRAVMSAAPALLGHLDDPDTEVRLAVQNAIIEVLRAAGTWEAPDPNLLATLDMADFARELIASGRMNGFTDGGAPTASKLLGHLARACVKLETPAVLNAIEALTDPPEIALAVAVVIGDAMRSIERWPAAIGTYRRATNLAVEMAAPAIEWRTLSATGECLAAADDHRSAWDCYQRAMKVIDQMWFALLEEGKLQQFFAEKARLYDTAALCALRLGYDALALECSEKSKTRYLGDLIARRQRDPTLVLHPELREFWRNTGRLQSIRVAAGPASGDTGEEQEIVAVGRREAGDESAPSGSSALMPRHLARFEEHWATLRGEVRERAYLVRSVWSKVASLQEDTADEAREKAAALHDAIGELRNAMESSADDGVLARFDQALSELLALGEEEPRFSGVVLSAEEVPYWISQLLQPATRIESTLLLEALQEALDTLLHRRPVLGVRAPSTGSTAGNVVFATRRRSSSHGNAGGPTTVIQSTLQRFVETRWRYTMMLARGDTIGFREIADSVAERSDQAHLQFTVTQESTVVHLIRGRQSQDRSQDAARRPAHEYETFTLPDVDDGMLRRLLVGGENSWFGRYGARRTTPGRRAWLKAIDDTLEALYVRVVAPIATSLEGSTVRRLQIVPHRGLHLVPFAGMYRKDGAARRYMIDDYEIAYAPSATLHHLCKQRAADKKVRRTLTAVGNPTEDLQFSPFEIDGVCAPFAPADRRTLLAKDASATELRKLATNCFFHFAGHAYYAWSKPLDSALVFANQHRLTVGALFDEGLPLSETMLVVLSACETNITDPHDLADEYLGLAAAFLFAGTPAVVCTLWAVDDLATMLLMGKFYRLLMTPSDTDSGYLRPAAAMRRAQLWLRDLTAQQMIAELGEDRLREIRTSVIDGKASAGSLGLLGDIVGRAVKANNRPLEHPYYWAAFIVVGDHAPLTS